MRERLNEPLRVRILPNIALFYILSTIFSSQAFGQVGSDGKVLPAKGDSNCPSLAERYNEFMNNKTPSVWYNPCNEIPAPPLEVPDNGIVLQIFLSLPAFGEELEYYFTMVVKWAIVGYLNEASAEYNVKLDTTIPSLDALFNGSNRHPNPAFQAEVVLQNTTTQIVQRHDASWWWSYQIIFYCFWGNANPRKSGQPLMNNTTLRKVEQDLNRYLREGIEIFDSFDFPVLSRGILGLSVIDPRDSATPFQDGPPTEPPKSTPSHTPDGFVPVPPTDAEDKKTRGSFSNTLLHSTYSTPIDSHFWDWRRYLGLSIFLATFVGTVLLTQIAAVRQRQRTTKQLWGNLGTEEGVNALLNTGWKVKGSKMEVYDKAGRGYSDDDSMLIGGFEQSIFD